MDNQPKPTMKNLFTLLSCLMLVSAGAQKSRLDPNEFSIKGFYYAHSIFDYPMFSQQLFLDILKDDPGFEAALESYNPFYVPTGHGDAIGFDIGRRNKLNSGAWRTWRFGLELVLHRQGSMTHREILHYADSTTETYINLVHHEKMIRLKFDYMHHPIKLKSLFIGFGGDIGRSFDEWIYTLYLHYNQPLPGIARYDMSPEWNENRYRDANGQTMVNAHITIGFGLKLGKLELSPQVSAKTAMMKVTNGGTYVQPIILEFKAGIRQIAPSRRHNRKALKEEF